jgi:hypothetical protein
LFGKDPQSLDRLLTIAGTITDIRATLPVSPAVDLEELTMLYDRGVVTWEEYVVQSRTMKGLITTTIPPEPPKDPENAAAAAPPKKRQRT